MSKKIGSRYMANVLGTKLKAVNFNGYEIKPAHFKKEVEIKGHNNGALGKYIVQCNKLVLSYCEAGGSSGGVAQFAKTYLLDFAKHNPETEIVIKHQPWNHPQLTGHYNCGTTKEVNLANLKPKEILNQFKLLHSSQGGKEIDFRKHRVISNNESVRGIWSPFHATQHKI